MSLLTSKLSDEDRKKAHELFEVPEQFDEVADLMVHEEEWQVILLMGKEPMAEKELRKLMEKNRLAASPYVLINRMYSRNVLNKVTDADEPTWKISDFYSRYSYYAQFEYYEFGCLPRELIEALYDWQTEIYQSIYLPQVKAKVAGEGVYVHNQTYLTLEEFDKIIDGHHGSIHLVPCNCKSQKYFHDRKLNVCVNMNDGPNSAVDRGMGEPISPEDMKKKVREFNASGLMQNGEDGFICNCDGLCCFPMQMAYKAGSRLVYPESNWKIDWHEDECVNCGKCTKICNFGAFYKDDNRKVHYDVDKCRAAPSARPTARSTLSTCCRESRRPERSTKALRNSILAGRYPKSGRPAFFLLCAGNGERKSAPWHLSKF